MVEGMSRSAAQRETAVRGVWMPGAMVGLSLLLGLAGCDKLQKSHAAETPKSSAASPSASVMPKPSVPKDQVVARVNNAVISKRDMELIIQNLKAAVQASGQTWTPLTPENLRELLNGLVLAELKAQEAVDRGLSRDAEVQYRQALLFRNFFAQQWDQHQREHLNVSDDEIKQFYESNPWYFRQPEERQLREIVVETEDQAKSVLVHVLEGVDFTVLADQNSLQPDLSKAPLAEQWVMHNAEKKAYAPNDETVRALEDQVLEQAAFAIDKQGGVSSYVKGAGGKYHIFQLADLKAGGQQELTDIVRENIRQLLLQQQLDKKSEDLRAAAKIETFDDRLTDIQQ